MKLINTSVARGFTLIELMVTLAVAAIVMAASGSSFKQLISSNRTTTTANTLVAALSFARSEAVKSGIPVLTYRKGATSQSWDAGWNVFFDVNGDGDYDSVGDTLLKTYDPIPTGFTLRTGNIFANSITYDATGLLIGAGAAGDTFTLCNGDADIATARDITVNAVGRVYTKTGTASCP